MKYRSTNVSTPIVLLVLIVTGIVTVPALEAGQQQDQKQQPKSDTAKSDTKSKGSALTGCVDEQQGHYVLVDARTMSPIANLDADGFPTESFAKHLGHTVTVRGTSSSNGARPTFKVRSIETVSERCEPHS